ncbi:hypothetical protein ABZZ04_20250 [Streptomyces sp. NPDC006435]|uniref:hypothetical protein n=1 Tax=Streptomyces sp. NPDC006435 TaxID=3154300 RepID=UPI00339FF91D
MSRSRVLAFPLIALAGAAFALAGCSSDGGSSGKEAVSDGTAGASADAGKGDGDAGAGKGSARLTYTGGASGEASIGEVSCAVLGGKLTAVNAPDNTGSSDPAKPSFSALLSDGKAMTTFVTADGKTYLHASSPGITSRQSGGTWVVTVAGLSMGPTDLKGDSITVDGSITCGSVAGM